MELRVISMDLERPTELSMDLGRPARRGMLAPLVFCALAWSGLVLLLALL
jgi:hypothetical protein